MMFAVLLYANMRGVKAIDRIVELCDRDLAFIWLTSGLKPGRDAFYEFIKNKLTMTRIRIIMSVMMGENWNIFAPNRINKTDMFKH